MQLRVGNKDVVAVMLGATALSSLGLLVAAVFDEWIGSGGGPPPPDTKPDPFTIPNEFDVLKGQLIVSAHVLLTGFDTPAPITITGGEYELNDSGVWSSAPGTANPNDQIRVRCFSSTEFATFTTAVLVVGGTSDTFYVKTLIGDTIPDPFDFTNQTNANRSTLLMSNSITPIGYNDASPISVTSGQYELNGNGTWLTSGVINPGDSIRLRHTTSDSFNTTVTTVLNIAGFTASFATTTLLQDTVPNAFGFTDQTGVVKNVAVVSNTVAITGINDTTAVSVVNGEYQINDAGPWLTNGTIDPGQSIRVRHTSANAPLTAINTTLTIGGVEDTFTSTTAADAVAGTIATPVITFANAAGAAPVISASSAQYTESLWVEWEFDDSLTPAKNPDGSYATPTQRGITLITGNAWAANDLTLGFNNPSGDYAVHIRVLRDNDAGAVTVTDQKGQTFNVDASAWSNDLADTVISSVGAFATTTGADKSTYVTVTVNGDGTQTLQCGVNNGGNACVRAFPAATNKRHIEVTIEDQFAGASGGVGVGVCEPSVAFNTNVSIAPGSSTGVNGFSVRMAYTSTSLTFSRNGAAVALALPGGTVYAPGDKIIIEMDVPNNQVTVAYYRIATGIVTTLASNVTLTSKIPATWNVWGNCNKGDATHKDRITFNFGKQPFVMTPNAGFVGL